MSQSYVAVFAPGGSAIRRQGAASILKRAGARVEQLDISSLPQALIALTPTTMPTILLFETPDRPNLATRALQAVRAHAPMPQAGAIAAISAGKLDRIDPASGFDDFAVHPYIPEDLVARVRAVEWRRQRRGGQRPAARISIDREGREVFVDGRPVPLTGREFQLLSHLCDNRGTPLAREDILRAVWGRAESSRTVDVHVRRLRKKLGAAFPLETLRKFGYRLRSPEPDAIAFVSWAHAAPAAPARVETVEMVSELRGQRSVGR